MMDAKMSRTRKKAHTISLILLGAFFILGYLLPLGDRPLMRPDEFRYGEIPREMLASGDWTTPRLNGIRYFEKPALGYQWTALSLQIFGQNPFAVRLPSALAAGLAAILVYLVTARAVRKDPWLPGVATGIFLGFGLVFGVGTFAVLDSQLAMALAWCVGAYYLAYMAGWGKSRWGWLLLAGVAAGAAFLFKGFLAFAVPAVVVAPFLIWQRDWKKFLTDPWLPLLLAVAVALPWSLAIARAEPGFWPYFFIEEHWKRFTSSTYDRDPQPFWFFIPVLLGGMMPCGLLAVAAWRGWTRNWLKVPFARFCVCWLVMPFLLFSASSCKLGTYILPCFPPLAILLAWGLRRAFRVAPDKTRRDFRVLSTVWGWIMMSAGVLGCMVFLIWRAWGAERFPLYSGSNFWPLGVTLGLAVYGGMVLLNRRRRIRWQLAWLLCGLLPVIWSGVNSIPAGVLHPSKMPEASLRKVFAEFGIRPDDVIALDRGAASSVAWVLNRTDLVVLGKMGEFEYGFTRYPEEYRGRYYKEKELAALLEAVRPRRLVYVVLRNRDDDPYPASWPVRKMASAEGVTIVGF